MSSPKVTTSSVSPQHPKVRRSKVHPATAPAQPTGPVAELATETASEQITLSREQFTMLESLHNSAHELWRGLQDVDCILFLCHEAIHPEMEDTHYPQFEGFKVRDGVQQALRLMFKELRRLDEGFDQVSSMDLSKLITEIRNRLGPEGTEPEDR